MKDVRMMDRIQSSQTKALNALKEVSEELYEAAIQVNNTNKAWIDRIM